MKKNEQPKKPNKDERIFFDSIIFDYYDFRLQLLAQKIKMKKYRQKKQAVMNLGYYV